MQRFITIMYDTCLTKGIHYGVEFVIIVSLGVSSPHYGWFIGHSILGLSFKLKDPSMDWSMFPSLTSLIHLIPSLRGNAWFMLLHSLGGKSTLGYGFPLDQQVILWSTSFNHWLVYATTKDNRDLICIFTTIVIVVE